MAIGIDRRQFISALGGTALAWPLSAHAQQTPLRVVGFLSGLTTAASKPMAAAFLQGLNESGFAAGRNVAIEYRYAEGHYDRLPALAADLVARKVDVIFANGGSAPALAAKAATTTISIVFETGGDPVKAGLVGKPQSPRRQSHRCDLDRIGIIAKRLDLLHQLVPPGLGDRLGRQPELSGSQSPGARFEGGCRRTRAANQRGECRHGKRRRCGDRQPRAAGCWGSSGRERPVPLCLSAPRSLRSPPAMRCPRAIRSAKTSWTVA